MSGGAPVDAIPVRPGEIVADKYRIERFIGSGGMGFVMEATHIQLLQRLAIKFVRADALDASSAVRLLREARAAVALESNHVARALDIGTLPSGMPFLVMEYLNGETLAAHLRRKKQMPVEEAVWMASQACMGLAEAHTRGIVHRDVKPANLFLARSHDGTVTTKVLDFGIAKANDPGIEVEAGLTSSDQALGTPRYMSPEQLSASSRVDARSDVWSIGVVLFECLAGEPPFARGSAFQIGAKILERVAPRVSELRPEVPAELDALIARCLETSAAARFADAGEVLAGLELTGIAPREVEDDLPPESEAAARGSVMTAIGIGTRAPVLEPTRVAPAVPAQPHVDRTAVMSAHPVQASPPGSIPDVTGTGAVPMRSKTPLLALLAVVVLMATTALVVGLRAKSSRADPGAGPELTAVPMTTTAPTTAPTPEPSTTAATEAPDPSAVAGSAGEDKPLPRGKPMPHRPPRPALTRPPNER